MAKRKLNLNPTKCHFTRLICGHWNIANTSYPEIILKLNFKFFEYRRLEFDYMTLFKLVNVEKRVNLKNFYKFAKKYSLREKNKKLLANIILTMFNGKFIFSIV